MRKHTSIQQLKEIPIARAALSLEVPKDPTHGVRLVRVELHFNVAPDVVLPFLRPGGYKPGFSGACVDVVGVGVAAVIAVACSEAVDVFGTVGEGAGPFADCGWVLAFV